MWQLIHKSRQKARRRYYDDCTEAIDQWEYDASELTEDEREVMERCKDRKYLCNIFPGQMYERQFNADQGDTCTWRGKVELIDLITKYKLYNDD